MTILRNTVTAPDGSPITGWFEVHGVGSPFRDGTQSEVLGPVTNRFAGGSWEVELTPGLYEVVQRRADGAFHSRWAVRVPDSEAPVWLADCLVTLPATPNSVPLLGIAAAVVDDAGHLLLTYTSGLTVDVGLVVGGGGGGAVDSVNGQTGVVVLDADDIGDGTSKVLMVPAERTKLAGIATGATANSSDTFLRSRGNHTGTQAAATLSDLTETVQDIVGAFLVAGTGVVASYDDAGNTFTITATGGDGGTTDPEIVRDVIGAAIVAGAGIQVTVNDAGDTITVASTAVLPTRQVNSGTGLTGGGDLSADRTLAVSYGTTAGTAAQGNDARLSDQRVPTDSSVTDAKVAPGAAIALSKLATDPLERSNHTGTQTAATISDLREQVEDYVAALLAAGSNVTLQYVDNGTGAGSLTIASTGGGSTDPEAVRDAIGIALVGAGLISVAVDDAGDTITLSTTATANSTDAQLRDRSTHSGSQAIATVTGLQAALDTIPDTPADIGAMAAVVWDGSAWPASRPDAPSVYVLGGAAAPSWLTASDVWDHEAA